jgi:hypothetical protein
MNDQHTYRVNAEEIAECFPLLSAQMLTALRVMSSVGHVCKIWKVPADSTTLATLQCAHCPAEATIHLIDANGDARYTVLLLPPGDCPHRQDKHTTEAGYAR